MRRVIESDRELFRKALIEVFAEKYDNALAKSDDDVVCSEAHMRAMEEIVAQAVRSGQKKNRRRWLITLLVAAALLLSACTVYAYRGEIRGYVEKIYDEYVHVTYRDSDEAGREGEIEEFYTLGYVPEGYKFDERVCTRFSNQCKWVLENEDYLYFEQYDLTVVNFLMNLEEGETNMHICGEYEVYCWIHSKAVYVWNDGQYAYKIKSSSPISKEELTRMVNSLTIEK